jgi:hypothetical protein
MESINGFAVLRPTLPITEWRKLSFFLLHSNHLLGKPEINDQKIKERLLDILPNVSKEIANEESETVLENWIMKAISYSKTLMNDYEDMCNRQIKSLGIIQTHRILGHRLDMSKIRRLPLEVEDHIRSYFLPRTRLEILLSNHTNMEGRLRKLTLPWLNNIIHRVIWSNLSKLQLRFCRYYKKNDVYRNRCQNYYAIEICKLMRLTSRRKGNLVDCIMSILFMHTQIKNAPSNYMVQLIHKTLFRIWHSVIYIESKYILKKTANRVEHK